MIEQAANGDFKPAIDCAVADNIGGGCTLTNCAPAQTEQAGLYTQARPRTPGIPATSRNTRRSTSTCPAMKWSSSPAPTVPTARWRSSRPARRRKSADLRLRPLRDRRLPLQLHQAGRGVADPDSRPQQGRQDRLRRLGDRGSSARPPMARLTSRWPAPTASPATSSVQPRPAFRAEGSDRLRVRQGHRRRLPAADEPEARLAHCPVPLPPRGGVGGRGSSLGEASPQADGHRGDTRPLTPSSLGVAELRHHRLDQLRAGFGHRGGEGGVERLGGLAAHRRDAQTLGQADPVDRRIAEAQQAATRPDPARRRRCGQARCRGCGRCCWRTPRR